MRSASLKLCAAAVSALALTAAMTSPALAQMAKPAMGSEKTVMVGGAAMYPSKNIVENAVNSKDHTTLVAAVKAAGLVDTPVGPRPVHRLRPHQRRLRRPARGHGRHPGQA